MRSSRWRWAIRFLALAIVVLVVVSFVVMSLWNWLAPVLFGWREIGLLQAAALLVLCRILFGGLRGYAGMHWRRRLAERWETMTPEERAQLRDGMRGCCGARTDQQAQTQTPPSTAASA